MTRSTLDPERSVHRAHSVIRAFVQSVGSLASEDPERLVATLLHVLPAHFAVEERADGFFSRLAAAGVSQTLLDRLRADHREFLERLARLERDVSVTDVSGELSSLASRLRDHEWIESVTAVRVGQRAPTDPLSDDGPGLRALRPELAERVGPIARAALAACTGSTDALLSGVTIEVPDTAPAEACRAAIEEALSALGLDFVEVDVVPCEGPLALREARFTPSAGRPA